MQYPIAEKLYPASEKLLQNPLGWAHPNTQASWQLVEISQKTFPFAQHILVEWKAYPAMGCCIIMTWGTEDKLIESIENLTITFFLSLSDQEVK